MEWMNSQSSRIDYAGRGRERLANGRGQWAALRHRTGNQISADLRMHRAPLRPAPRRRNPTHSIVGLLAGPEINTSWSWSWSLTRQILPSGAMPRAGSRRRRGCPGADRQPIMTPGDHRPRAMVRMHLARRWAELITGDRSGHQLGDDSPRAATRAT